MFFLSDTGVQQMRIADWSPDSTLVRLNNVLDSLNSALVNLNGVWLACFCLVFQNGNGKL